MNIKTICMWCKEFLHGDRTGKDISHGICKKCLRIHYPEFAEEIIKEMEEKETV